MEYKFLKDSEKDVILKDFLLAQERDHHCHTVNAERYRKILSDPSLLEGAFKENIIKLLRDTEDRLLEVELIIRNSK